MIVVLDRAHGKDVDKGASDGSFMEYEVSQKTIDLLTPMLIKKEIEVHHTVKPHEDYEIGLSERVRRANSYNPDLFISFHNNAGGGEGNELFTCPNPDESTILCADVISEYIISAFPEMSWRITYPNQLYKTANFSVLVGYETLKPNYIPILVEWGFMDNEKDIDIINNNMNRFVNAMYLAILDLNYKLWE